MCSRSGATCNSIYQFIHWFTLQNGNIILVIIDFHVDSTSSASFKGYNVMFT